MKRRNLMKALGIGTAASLGVGTAQAQSSENSENGSGNNGGQNRSSISTNDGGRYTPYDGMDTKTAPGPGPFDQTLMYLAEGINPLEFESPRADDNRFGVEGDPLLSKFWHFDIQQRTVDEIIADRQAHHDYAFEHFGIDMQGEYYGEARTVPPATFAPPLGQRGKKARWAFPDEGPDEYTGDPVPEEGITEQNMFDTFVWRPDPNGGETDAVVPETSLMLRPEVGYTNYLKSGAQVPANYEDDDELGEMTNRDPFVANKVRDGGYWIFAIEDDDIGRNFIRRKMKAAGADPPRFWYNTQADGELRQGRGVAGGKDPDVDPPDKLFLDDVGPDAEFQKGLPEEMGTFWGHYNIYRGENRDPISIHYRSAFPTEFNPHSGIPRAFMCELQCEQFATDRNPKGLGRVHGSTYPTATTVAGNTNGHNFREHGPPEGAPASTIRNVLTFPASLTRGRADDPEDERQYNIAPGWPEAMPDSQFDIPGFPEALKGDNTE